MVIVFVTPSVLHGGLRSPSINFSQSFLKNFTAKRGLNIDCAALIVTSFEEVTRFIKEENCYEKVFLLSKLKYS